MSLASHHEIDSTFEDPRTVANSINSKYDEKELEESDETPDRGVRVEGDTLIVDWNGADDPMNPRNWTNKRRWIITAIISSITFTSALPSSMIAPGVAQISDDFDLNNKVVGALVTSIFVLSLALGPLVVGPLSEIYGRVPVIVVGNTWFLIWNTICGFAQSTPQIIVFRFLAGLGASVPIGIGNSILGDMWSEEKRGRVVSTYNLMPSLSPALGPLIGSWIAAKTTWRWVFWSLSMFQAVVMLGTLYLGETYPPVLLERKAKRIRTKLTQLTKQDVNTIGFYGRSSISSIKTVYDNEGRRWQAIFAKAMLRPFVLFAQETIIQVLGLYLAFGYGMLYFLLTTIPATFKIEYGQSLGVSGLNYIALALGIGIASQSNANIMNPMYKYLKNRQGGVRKPEFRLPPMVPASILLPLGLLLTGWSTQKHLHWILPDLGLFFFGMGMIVNLQCIQLYVVDAFTLYSASALASVTCLRSLAGFAFPLFAPVMYDKLGYGKGNTVLASIAIVIGCPAPILLWIYGERIRGASKYSKNIIDAHA